MPTISRPAGVFGGTAGASLTGESGVLPKGTTAELPVILDGVFGVFGGTTGRVRRFCGSSGSRSNRSGCLYGAISGTWLVAFESSELGSFALLILDALGADDVSGAPALTGVEEALSRASSVSSWGFIAAISVIAHVGVMIGAYRCILKVLAALVSQIHVWNIALSSPFSSLVL